MKFDLQLAKKIFNGLPKLFHPRLNAGIDAYNEYVVFLSKQYYYSFYVQETVKINNNAHEKRTHILIDLEKIIRKTYKNRLLQIKPDVISFNDICVFPESFKKDVLKSFFTKLVSLFEHRPNVKLSSWIPHSKNRKTIAFNSFEELLMMIDMNVVE